MKPMSPGSCNNEIPTCSSEQSQIVAALEEAARVGMPSDVIALMLADALAGGADLVDRMRNVFNRVQAMRARRVEALQHSASRKGGLKWSSHKTSKG